MKRPGIVQERDCTGRSFHKKATEPVALRRLYRDLVASAKLFDWHSNEDPRIHHRYDREADWDQEWEAKREETLRLVFSGPAVFHLQIRYERKGKQASCERVIIFGRRVKGLEFATPNTQRATFNSNHVDDVGFWLRPNLDDHEKNGVANRLPGPSFPRWDGRHIQLGSDIPYVILRRYLIALAVIEEVKGGWPVAQLPFAPEMQLINDGFEAADLNELISFQEGRELKIATARRARCQRLLGEAREYFRSLAKDGKLHCSVCRWCPRVPTRREIVEIHHLKRLADYPRNGRWLTLAQALANLAPLCPNCHRMLESKPNGGLYSLEELKTLMKR